MHGGLVLPVLQSAGMKSILKPLVGLCAVLLIARGAAGNAFAAERPNFVFIYTDDQRWDALGVVQREQGDAARFPWLATPHLDRLASEGIRFRNAFVVSSLCSPSRAAFLTGRYNHANGIANNHTPFPAGAVTWATQLKGAGYRTGYIGKFHMGPMKGQRPGFDYSASFVGQGRYTDCPFEINGVSQPTTGWVDDVSTDFAIEFLKANRERPLALVVGFKSAHGPFQPPPRLADKYTSQTARPTPNTSLAAVYSGNLTPRPAKAEKKKKAKAAPSVGSNPYRGYFGCLTAVDENVGRLLAALDELKLAENTVVIFTSDNGFYLGEHGLGDKRTAYDESLRIPLLVRWPKLGDRGRSRLVDQMALNIDLAPTLLDLAGVTIPAEMQGRSWRPLLENNAAAAADWRKAFFYEYFYEANFTQIPTVLAVRTERAKLIKYPGHDDWTELFDLAADPYETKNLAADPASKELLAAMQAEYDRQAAAVRFQIPDYADTLPAVAK